MVLEYREIPNLHDPVTMACGLQVQNLRRSLTSLILDLARQNTSRPGSESLIVVFAVFSRIVECSLSAELLAIKGHHRDCGTLIATLIEMRTDLQFIAKDPGHAAKWLQHKDSERLPWSMKTKWNTIFAGQPRDLEAHRGNYRRFCSVKHANPYAKSAAFDLSPEDGNLMNPRKDLAQRILPTYLFSIGLELRDAAVAGGQLVEPGGFDIQARLDEMSEAMDILDAAHMAHLTSIAVEAASGR